MNIPIIGVTPLWDEEKDSLWMLPGYMDGIRDSGGLPVMLPLTSDKAHIQQICRMADGFLFTGGHDIFPGLYGCEVSASCGPVCSERDSMESMLFTEAVIELDMPAFGICRGLQLFNVMLGGTLYQDLPTQYKGEVSIKHEQDTPGEKCTHNMHISRGSPLFKLLGCEEVEVNSSHHQGICKMPQQLESMARADDGLIEAVYMPDRRFAWAVQWHPERALHDNNSHLLFDAFIGACNHQVNTD